MSMMDDWSVNGIGGLSSPDAYPHAAPAVRVIQTHISFILLAGEYAYKIKKPVDLGFVDYSTLEIRRAMCVEEVRLNRRLCDGVYLGVVPITREGGGAVRVGGQGEVIEYAVQMKRVPDDRMMPSLLASHGFTSRHLHLLAADLARFHDHAATSERIASFGSPRAIADNWQENFEVIRRYVGRTIEPSDLESMVAYTQRFIERNGPLLVERARAGRIRDCHGDLRSDSVVVWADGRICMMDCIEFAERLRCGDVASEVAFLAMDLEFRRYTRLADEFVSAYLERVADATLPIVLNFYRAYRAYVRGKVESILMDESEIGETAQREAGDRATKYFALAKTFAADRPPALVMMAGLSGSGKSWLASALAGRLSAALIRSDAVRREFSVSDLAAPEPFGEGSYTEQERARVYMEIFERAESYLDAGHGVVLDATFAKRSLRDRAREIARERNMRFLAIELTADEHVIRERLDARLIDPGLSDARWDTYIEQRGRYEPLEEIPADEHTVLNSSQPLDELVSSAITRIAPS